MGLPEIFQSIRPSIVALGSRISITRAGTKPLFPEILGTGFIVDPRGIVATNRHVVEEISKLPPHPYTGANTALAILFTEVEVGDGQHGMGTILRGIRGHWLLDEFSTHGAYFGASMPDLAFLHLDVKDVPAVTLATEPNVLTIGREIATAGFPLGNGPLTVFNKITQLTPMLRRGIISSVFPFPCPHPHGFTIVVMTQGGASGSPIFLAESQTVVGILHANVVGATNITIALPSKIISEAVEKFFGAEGARGLDLSEVPTFSELRKNIERTPELSYNTFEPTDITQRG